MHQRQRWGFSLWLRHRWPCELRWVPELLQPVTITCKLVTRTPVCWKLGSLAGWFLEVFFSWFSECVLQDKQGWGGLPAQSFWGDIWKWGSRLMMFYSVTLHRASPFLASLLLENFSTPMPAIPQNTTSEFLPSFYSYPCTEHSVPASVLSILEGRVLIYERFLLCRVEECVLTAWMGCSACSPFVRGLSKKPALTPRANASSLDVHIFLEQQKYFKN